jgi:hypothetical protein
VAFRFAKGHFAQDDIVKDNNCAGYRETTPLDQLRRMAYHEPIGWTLEDVFMKRFLVAAIVCFAFGLSCMAQSTADSPATKEDVERYLQAIHSHDMMSKMADAMSRPMHQMVHDEYTKNQDRLPANFEAQTNQRVDGMMKNMPWDEMMEAMVPAYQKHFTKGDIDALVAFYSSPTGQKMLREMPEIMADAMQAVMPIMRQHMDAVNKDLQEQMAQSLKEREQAPQASPTPRQ